MCKFTDLRVAEIIGGETIDSKVANIFTRIVPLLILIILLIWLILLILLLLLT
jgi:hypothetical protein